MSKFYVNVRVQSLITVSFETLNWNTWKIIVSLPQGTHTICLCKRCNVMLIVLYCFICSGISTYVHVSKLNKRCATLPSANCRPFAWGLAFWVILKGFVLSVVYCTQTDCVGALCLWASWALMKSKRDKVDLTHRGPHTNCVTVVMYSI